MALGVAALLAGVLFGLEHGVGGSSLSPSGSPLCFFRLGVDLILAARSARQIGVPSHY